MMRWRNGWQCGVASLLFFGAVGCAAKDAPVPVDGVVTLDGNPVAGAAVLFMPAGEAGRPASGRTNRRGIFRLSTYRVGDGALPGAYRVVVTKTEAIPPPPEAKPDDRESVLEHYKALRAKKRKESLLPVLYADSSKTPLRCTVPPGTKVMLELHAEAHR
jgi:hypothetical protein